MHRQPRFEYALSLFLIRKNWCEVNQLTGTAHVHECGVLFLPLHCKENNMLVIRDIMYCKPGKVKPMVEKFVAMNKLGAKLGFPKMRIMTDVAAERYWTIVAEMEVESFEVMEKMMS